MSNPADRVRFVLVAPTHPGNIGASARAIKTMGFARLVVVRPRQPDYREDPDAVALSTGAADVLAASASFATLTEALGGVRTAIAMTGYDRQFGPPLADLRSCAGEAAARVNDADEEVAFVFGTERSGLENEDVERCQKCCAIPANPAFASLNLAQAVLIALYELHLAAADATRTIAPPRKDAPPPTAEEFERYFADAEKALRAIEFFKTRYDEYIMRSLRSLTFRASPNARELTLLRAMSIEVVRYLERTGRT